ncbi:uncharacterized protein EV422DRAFT_522054 [Fimicolochytrium jonesii]|uniref:uncharacterized protein n=1 Tax=Fimicolochytrium jonesii TaxID=1396493 RepID=UPI0022FF3D41|nr:uncharacterized protein EV422DRAFT_522054 [Fimicolochytrium jonesii]KAI8823708.1 hypothetical protein EV422DRAFT_522054 [Fimicolochytrium jonesii]
MPKRKTSVWDHFTEPDNHGKKYKIAKCSYCNGTPFAGQAERMEKHLINCSNADESVKEFAQDLIERRNQTKLLKMQQEAGDKNLALTPIPRPRPVLGAHIDSPYNVAATPLSHHHLSAAAAVAAGNSAVPPIQTAADIHLLIALTELGIPFTITENQNFRKFLRILNVEYEIPTPLQLSSYKAALGPGDAHVQEGPRTSGGPSHMRG